MIPNVKYHKALRIQEGTFIHNPKELLIQLKLMKDEEFQKFQSINPGSINNWLNENYKAKELTKKFGKKTTRREYIFHLENYIKINETENEIKKSISMDAKIMFQYALIVFILIIVVLQFTAFTKKQEQYSSQSLASIINSQLIEIQKLNEEKEILKATNNFLERKLIELNESRIIIPREAENPGPSDRIKIENLEINKTHIAFKLENSLVAEFSNTGSMLPTLSSTATAIQIKPKNETDLEPGDIISYRYENSIIVHRIVEIGYDFEGWYAYAKGDNNPLRDKDKIRFSQIDRVLVAIIY